MALNGGCHTKRLARQARAHSAEPAVTSFAECCANLTSRLAGSDGAVVAGPQVLIGAAERPADRTMPAMPVPP